MDYHYTTRLEETRDEAPVRALAERSFAGVEHSEWSIARADGALDRRRST